MEVHTMVCDILICGGGIIGLTIARELIKAGYKNILIIDKENALGKHASGRNSGVLHAGIYYTPDSLRARLSLKGNFLMKQYCREKKLPLLETGKAIVVRDEKEVGTLKELYNRAVKNGAKVELIDEKQLAEIEPDANTYKVALYSYYTAVLNPKAVLESLYNDFGSSGKIKILKNTEFKGIKGNNTAITNKEEIQFDFFINAAGAHSDKVAHTFGVGLNYKLIPFKGIYKKLKHEKSSMVKGNIYPVPDIKNPFLGIHFTKNVEGEVYVGPTAFPAVGRENYGLLGGINLESINILLRDFILSLSNSKFRNVALMEPKKYFPKFFFKDAKKLVKTLEPDDIQPSDKVGIRPQLVDWGKKELIMDFIVIRDGNSVHILNATSPAFTSSMAFAELVVREYIKN